MKTSKEKKQSKKSRSSGEKYRSITTDLGIMIITLSTIAVLVLGGAFAYLFNANIKANLETQLKAGASENALVLEKYITGMQIYSESMAESFRNFKIMGEAQGGSMIRGTLKSAVESGRVFSAYAAFEPNLFFTSTPRGLSYYAYDLGAGVQVDTANNYEVYAAEDYYAKAKESLAVHVTAPYAHTMPDGTQIFLISLSTPIIVNGRFVGVANCDIRADDLLSLGYSAEGFDAHYQMFVDSEDKVLMHSLKPELAGQPANSRERIDALKSSGESRMSHWQDAAIGEKVMGVYVPLHLNGTDVEWYSAFVVSYREARTALFRTIGIVAILGILGIIIMAALCMRVIHRTMAPIKPLTSMAESMGRFDIDHIDTAYRFPKNEIGRLADSFLGMSEGLRNIVKDIDGLLGAMAEGDFASGSGNPEKYVGAMENVLHSLQQIQTRLGSSLSAISYSADQVAGSSHQIASGAQSLAQGASEQASSLEELTSMVNVVNDDVRSNAKNAELASEIAVSTQRAITEGNAEMKELKESMDNIAEASMQIQAVIGLIDSIAFQTNILALNAAIEAARAGEAGKGFAVVADEVRNLAQKSAEAAQSTGELINTSVAAVEKGKGIAEETARAMQSVAEYAEKSKDMISMISEASRKQAEAITQIHTGLNQIASVVQTNSSTSEESAAASQELSHEAERLKELVSPYRFS